MNNETEIIIEKGIPIQRVRASGITETLRRMEVGDSFLMERESALAAHGCARGLGMKVALRKQPCGKLRVWRVK